MMGGVIRWVLSEIQSLELRNAPTTTFTERTSNELEVSNFFDQLISDRAQYFGNIIIWWEESFGELWGKSNHCNYAIHQPLRLRNELEMSNFFDHLISDRAQYFENIII